jgi:Ca-activated chloride channel family protein
VTFLSSWRLVFLIAPVALLAAYLVAQRARQKAVVRFTSVDMLASVAPRRPGWQRHVPAAGLFLALVLLVISFAQPAHALRTPKQRATVMLTIDISNSMVATDVKPTRLGAAQSAARGFANKLPPGVQLGLISFSTQAQVLVAPTTDRTTVLAAIDRLQANGGTATGDAITLALKAISALPPGTDGKAAPAAIVLMSDGSPNLPRPQSAADQAVADATTLAAQSGVKIDTIAFGTPNGVAIIGGETIDVAADPAAMAQIAKDSGGKTFTAQTANQLKSVYSQIGRIVGYDVHQHEITIWFTGIALVLTILAAVGALIWTQRLV